MNGLLFTQDFLQRGIQTTPVWTAMSESVVDAFIAGLHRIYAPYSSNSVLNEATTESEIILKVLGLLDWSDLVLPQVTASGSRREDVPDMLLLPDDNAKQLALKEKKEDRRYRHGIAVLEAKRWMRPLDRGDGTDRLDPGTPSNQILRYLSTVEVASERAVRWGLLTNGRLWRLYYLSGRAFALGGVSGNRFGGANRGARYSRRCLRSKYPRRHQALPLHVPSRGLFPTELG